MIKTTGIIPAGLVLNTRLDTTYRKFPNLAETGAVPIMNVTADSGMVSVPQASMTSLVRLRGRLLSPVLVQPLSEVYSAPLVTPDPLTDPCVLLSNALFDGEVLVFSGDDCPTHKIVARHDILPSGPVPKWSLVLDGLYPSWFIPRPLRQSRLVGIDASVASSLVTKGFKPIVSAVTPDVLPQEFFGPSNMAVTVYPLRVTTDAITGMARVGAGREKMPAVMWTVNIEPNLLPASPYINSIDDTRTALLATGTASAFIKEEAQAIAPIKAVAKQYSDTLVAYYVMPEWGDGE